MAKRETNSEDDGNKAAHKREIDEFARYARKRAEAMRLKSRQLTGQWKEMARRLGAEERERRSSAVRFVGWMKCISKMGPGTLKPGRAGAQRVDDIDFGDFRDYAKFAAMMFTHPDRDLFKAVIELPATIKHKQFFIDLGKCLSDDLDPQLYDKRDLDMAEIVLFSPQMSARDAMRELVRRGHHGITEDNFRMWRMRLLRAKREYDAFRRRKA